MVPDGSEAFAWAWMNGSGWLQELHNSGVTQIKARIAYCAAICTIHIS